MGWAHLWVGGCAIVLWGVYEGDTHLWVCRVCYSAMRGSMAVMHIYVIDYELEGVLLVLWGDLWGRCRASVHFLPSPASPRLLSQLPTASSNASSPSPPSSSYQHDITILKHHRHHHIINCIDIIFVTMAARDILSVFIVYCTVFTVHCAQCSLYTVHSVCTIYSVCCTRIKHVMLAKWEMRKSEKFWKAFTQRIMLS